MENVRHTVAIFEKSESSGGLLFETKISLKEEPNQANIIWPFFKRRDKRLWKNKDFWKMFEQKNAQTI